MCGWHIASVGYSLLSVQYQQRQLGMAGSSGGCNSGKPVNSDVEMDT